MSHKRSCAYWSSEEQALIHAFVRAGGPLTGAEAAELSGLEPESAGGMIHKFYYEGVLCKALGPKERARKGKPAKWKLKDGREKHEEEIGWDPRDHRLGGME